MYSNLPGKLNPAKPDLPFISIVIPTYNRFSLLKKAVQSVIEQTYKKWELIIADDGSSDGTIDFIKSIADPRIHILSLAHTGNIASVRNAGVWATAGDWIAFLDSDDIWIPEKLEIQLRLVREKAARWVYGKIELINEQGDFIPMKAGTYVSLSGWITPQLISCEAAVNLGTLLLERNLFNEAGGFHTEEKLNCREDYEFILRLSLRAEAWASDQVLAKVRDHQSRTTAQLKNGHLHSAYAYKHFIRSKPGRRFRWMAWRQIVHHYYEHILSACSRRLQRFSFTRKYKTPVI